MRIFVTGATGFIGSQIVGNLLARGDEVLGLARSDTTAAALAERGAAVWRGDLAEPEALAAAARESDGVIHTAFDHDFSKYVEAGEQEQRVIEALTRALAGTGKPLVAASGTGVVPPGGDERDAASTEGFARVRGLAETLVVAAAEQGVRASAVRLPPSVHDRERQGLVSLMIERAREAGFSAYVGDGSNRWPAVHRRDAARLFLLALDRAQAGARLHAVGEEGVPLRAIAHAIGEGLRLPVRTLSEAEAAPHFGFLAMLVGVDARATCAITQQTMGWTPSEPGLLDGLRNGGYLPGVSSD
ncbi:MAG TPA: SDR family oxidoreductase [Caulobacteraceae bacterium]|nr:SDR family oxidoreductase [Caulobacteraceae bacterium]